MAAKAWQARNNPWVARGPAPIDEVDQDQRVVDDDPGESQEADEGHERETALHHQVSDDDADGGQGDRQHDHERLTRRFEQRAQNHEHDQQRQDGTFAGDEEQVGHSGDTE